MNRIGLTALVPAVLLGVLLASTLVACESDVPKASAAPAPAVVSIEVDEDGYHPSSVEAHQGSPLVLSFERTSDKGCGDEVEFPDLDIRKKLPLGQKVRVELTPEKKGSLAFTCGMGMYKGAVVVTGR